MKTKENTNKKTIKQEVLEDFLINKKFSEENGLNYMPSGVLKFYLLNDKGYPSYPARIIAKYCKENNIEIIKWKDLDIEEWFGERVHKSMGTYRWII